MDRNRIRNTLVYMERINILVWVDNNCNGWNKIIFKSVSKYLDISAKPFFPRNNFCISSRIESYFSMEFLIRVI